MFGISRQAIYQRKQRISDRELELSKVKNLVNSIRMQMPRLGTHKLYYLIKSDLEKLNIKMGRDALFSYLHRENLLIYPKKNYKKTTDSNH